jgi:CRISPR-associated protein Cmr6
MPIAAVPSYLGNDVKEASPAMRFGLLLPVWTTRQDQEAEVNRRAQARSREGQEVQSLLEQGMDVAIRALRQRQPHPLPGLWAKNDFAARNSWAMVKALTASDRVRMTAVLTRQWAIAQTVSDSALIRLDARAIAPLPPASVTSTRWKTALPSSIPMVCLTCRAVA